MDFSINGYLNSHVELALNVDQSMIQNGIDMISTTLERGGKILTCGNGGSAYTASHFITDWNKMYNLAHNKKFIGISLCDNIGLVTAYANDISYGEIFSGQLKTLLNPEDLLIAVSGSGNSLNVINAVDYANSIGAETLGIIGYDGGLLKNKVKKFVWIQSYDMQLCEDFHLMFGHMVMKSICKT